MSKKRILIVDPGNGGGIEQASIYLYDYLLHNGFEARYATLKDPNDVPLVFKAFSEIYKSFKPDLVMLHECHHIEVFACLRCVYPEVIISYFSLPEGAFEGQYYGKVPLDFIISPAYLNTNKTRDLKNIPWMFDMPSRFYSIYNENKNKSSSLLYVGRVMEQKLSSAFIELIKKTDLTLDVYGKEEYKEEIEYKSLLRNAKQINFRGRVYNYNIENIYSNYETVVLPSKTDCFSLFAVEAILSGCYPFIMTEQHYRRYPWMNLNFHTYQNESDMVYGIGEFMVLSKKAKIDLQKKIREPLVEYLKEVSDIGKIEDILKLDGKEISYFNNVSIKDIADYSHKY